MRTALVWDCKEENSFKLFVVFLNTSSLLSQLVLPSVTLAAQNYPFIRALDGDTG